MSEAERTRAGLKQLQALPLHVKIPMTQGRIRAWYQNYDGKVYVSYSGGKDSTVLLHLVRQLYPDVKAVFSNTGLEFPEIQSFARKLDNVDIIRPKMMFNEVIEQYGYPLVSKEVAKHIQYARRNSDRHYTILMRERLMGTSAEKTIFIVKKWFPLAAKAPFKISNYCCSIMKKSPIAIYERANSLKPILGTMASESAIRTQAWLKNGCNVFDGSHPSSQPLSFWTEQDVLQYIKENHLEIASVYGDILQVDKNDKPVEVCEDIGYFDSDSEWHDGTDDLKLKCSGCQRTGCIFCAFGAHLEKGETRFQRLAKTHPKQYDYCINGGQWIDNPDYDPSYNNEPDEIGWVKWNPKQLWVPSKEGLGMGKVFDIVNEIYEKDLIRYK